MSSDKDYFDFHAALEKHRRRDMEWVRKSIPALREHADGFNSDTAFVLGTGPSIYPVKSEQWQGISEHYSIGLNHFAKFALEEIKANMFPALLMVIDGWQGESLKYFQDLFNRHKSPLLSAYGGGDQHIPATYRFPGCTMNPVMDLEFGISFSPRFVKFNRSSFAATHLAAMLGFKRIVLLGVDHNESYKEGDSIRARHAFDYMRRWLEKNNIELVQAGQRSGFYDAVPFTPLEEILSVGATA